MTNQTRYPQLPGDASMRRKLTRRSLLGGAFGAVLLAACGDSSEDAPSAGSTSTTGSTPGAQTRPRLFPSTPQQLGAPAVPPATTTTVSTAVPYEPTVAVYKNFGTTAAPGVFPRTIKHAMGETTISKPPVKVVVLDTGERDAVIDMGIKPVGVIESSSTPSYLGSALNSVPIMGTILEPNIEAVAAAQPDLILSNKLRHEALYSKFAAIAPTVFGERAGLVWRHNYELYALALGKEEQAGKTIEKYETRVKSLNTKFPTPRPSVSVIRVQSDGKLRYYQRANFIGIVLADMGFPRPEGQNVDDFGLVNMGFETLGQYGDADLIVASVIGGSSNAAGQELVNSAVWKSLNAVKKGAVMMVDDAVWIGGLGYLAADVVMDDLAKYFKV